MQSKPAFISLGRDWDGAYRRAHLGHEDTTSKLQDKSQRALVACSLWLHIGFIGAAALAVGVLQLFAGEARWPFALALAFSGGVLAAASWRRGLTVLERADRDQPSLSRHSPPWSIGARPPTMSPWIFR